MNLNQIAKWCVCCAFIWCFVPGLAGAVNSSPPATLQVPSISVPETDYNFGEVIETEPVSHDFIIRNGGKAELHIKDVAPS
jgi:hypothetical protein